MNSDGVWVGQCEVEGVVKRGGVQEREFERRPDLTVMFSSSLCFRKTCLTGFRCRGFEGDMTNFLLRALRLNPFLEVEDVSPCSLTPVILTSRNIVKREAVGAKKLSFLEWIRTCDLQLTGLALY